jgi:predicted metal-dependent enzyme (double-stranded beta helix superfamily)
VFEEAFVFHELVDDLRCTPPLDRSLNEMARLLRSVCSSGAPLNGRLIARPQSYTRTCLYRDDRFEVLLLNWSPGAASALHDHGGQHCWLAVLEGRLDIDDYVRLDEGDVPGHARIGARGSRALERGGLDLRSGRFDLHKVSARRDGPAVSLHVYSQPLEKFLIYDQAAQRCETAFGTYDEVVFAGGELARR